jgi:soluble lytic murein transglycosylase-like protein
MQRTLLVAVALAAVAVNSVAHAEGARRQDAGRTPAGIDRTTTASLPKTDGPGFLSKLIAGKSSADREKAAKVDVKAVKSELPAIVTRYAREYGVPVSLAHAVVTIESNFRPNARGRAGEIGLMQIKPATARMMGYSGSAKGLYDPETNVKYGMKYLAKAHALGGGDTCGTILRYNAGHAAKRMNRVSSAYCTKVKRVIGS